MAGGGVGVEGHHFTFGRTAAPDNSTEGLRKWSEALQSSGSVESRTVQTIQCFIIITFII